MKAIDIFCGIGGWSAGLASAGIDVVAAIDKWEGCKDTYTANHLATRFILADVLDVDPVEWRGIDVVVGSPPCQLFSVGNQRRDPARGMELVRAFERWIRAIRPRYWVMENVAIIEGWLGGFYPVKHVLNCADYGVPQARNRCFAGDFMVPAQTHAARAGTTLFGEKIDKHVTLRQAIAGTYDTPADAVMTDQFGTRPAANSPYFSPDKPSRTVTSVGMRAVPMAAAFDKRAAEEPAAAYDKERYRPLTLDELAKLQSFPAGYQLVGKPADLVTGVANAVPPLMARALAAEIVRVESKLMQGSERT